MQHFFLYVKTPEQDLSIILGGNMGLPFFIIHMHQIKKNGSIVSTSIINFRCHGTRYQLSDICQMIPVLLMKCRHGGGFALNVFLEEILAMPVFEDAIEFRLTFVSIHHRQTWLCLYIRLKLHEFHIPQSSACPIGVTCSTMGLYSTSRTFGLAFRASVKNF